MNIILYGVPTATAEQIAARYALRMINSPDKFDASGTVMAVPPISAPRYLFAFYKAMIRHEAEVDAVIVCGADSHIHRTQSRRAGNNPTLQILVEPFHNNLGVVGGCNG